MKDKIYQACFCPCIYESADATLSIHRTREGAERAIAMHKEFERKEFEDIWKDEDGEYTDKHMTWESHCSMMSWSIRETELKD